MSAVLPPVSTPTVAPGPAAAWRLAGPALLAVLLLQLLLYRDSFAAMAGIWSRSDTFAHAFLVPPIVLWLVWRQRAHLARVTPRPQLLWLLPLACAAFGWLLADLAGVNAGSQLMVTAMLVLSVPAVLGWAVARLILFPLLFLFFMVPIGEFMLPQMMEWTADFTVAAIALSGIPVYREGLQFVIPSGNWSVVEACSGVRYLIASFMVGTLFAYLNYRSWQRRAVFMLVSIAVPIVANWVRAYMIVMLGHLSGNELAVGADHLVYGWVFFGVIIMIMFVVGARWSEPDAPAPAPATVGLAAPPVSARFAWPAVLACAAVLVLPQVAQWQMVRAGAAGPVTLQLPELPGLPGLDQPPPLTPVFQGAAAEATRSYGAGAGAVHVHLAYYRQQGYEAKLVSSSNTLLRADDRQWVRTRQTRRVAPLGQNNAAFTVLEVLRGGAAGPAAHQRLEVRQNYWIDGRWTANNQAAALYGVWSRLQGRGDDAAAVTLMAGGEEAATRAALDDFGRMHLPAIGRALTAAQARR